MKLRTLLPAAAVLLAAACADGTAPTAPAATPTDASYSYGSYPRVELQCDLSAGSNPGLPVGESTTCLATVNDGWRTYVATGPVQWSSSAPMTISVDGSGTVTAHRTGSATISATTAGMTGSIQLWAW